MELSTLYLYRQECSFVIQLKEVPVLNWSNINFSSVCRFCCYLDALNTKEDIFNLMMHSTHFSYGYVVLDIL